MKSLLLASAAVLGIGMSSAFAATVPNGYDNPPTVTQNTAPGYQAQDNAGARLAYDAPNAGWAASAPATTFIPQTPPSAAEAYQGDSMGVN